MTISIAAADRIAELRQIIEEAPTTRRGGKITQMAEMEIKMLQRPAIPRSPEGDAAYTQYISDGLADTDGYFAPISRESFYYFWSKQNAA